MGQSVIQRSFHAGELAPALHARADQAKYAAGLRTCRNFVIQAEGGASNRAGFRFVQACKTTSQVVQLLPYVSEVDGESLLLEQGVGYIRFFLLGAPLTIDPADVDLWDVAINYAQGDLAEYGGALFYAKVTHTGHATSDATYWHPLTNGMLEVPTPFTHLMNWSQSGRVITLTHKDEAPHELTCVDLSTWLLTPIDTVPTLEAPANVIVTPGAVGTRTFGYVVTALADSTYEESPASGQTIQGSMAAGTADDPTVITWDAVTGAAEYHIYSDPFQNGVYGYIGTASGATTFNDTGINPDFAQTPPVPQDLFAAPDDYPHVSVTHQQRRIFGYTNTDPEAIWGSRTGLPRNFGISTPIQEDDAIRFRLAGMNHNPIRRLISLKTLVVMTDAGEWTIGAPHEPISPSNLPTDQETYVGIDPDVRPVVVGNAILYVQARGKIVRDLRFDQEVEGLGGRDLMIWARHLTKRYTLEDLDYQQNPDSTVWAVRDDGTLLGLTYVRDQEIWGWHRHDTGAAGRFEHVCVVPEVDEDALYVIVRRTIGGSFVRYIERLERRTISTATFDTDAFFLDSALTYSGAPVSTVNGLAHLNGQSVMALVDGTPRGPFTVAAGAVALGVSGSVVHVGLPITADLETLDLDVAGSPVRDQKKRVGTVTLLLEDSCRSWTIGPDVSHLTTNVRAPWESVSDLYTGADEIKMQAEYGDSGRVFLRHTDPLPLTVLAIIPNQEVGG